MAMPTSLTVSSESPYQIMPRLPSHTEADPGVATVVSFDPETRSGGIIFSNSPTITFGGQKIFYQEMMKKLLKF